MLFSTLYNIVDTFYAGYFGTQAQAGLSVGFQAFFVLVSVGFGPDHDCHIDRSVPDRGGVRTGDLPQCGLSYFNWLVVSLPGFILAFTANGILQVRGDTVSMQRALIVAFFANILLNPVLMFGVPGLVPAMGFNGIALATVFSQSGVAAYGISLRLEQLFLLPAVGITIALVPIAAQNYGAGNYDRARQSFRRCWTLGVIATMCAFPFLWFGGGFAISLFSSDPGVIRVGAMFLKIEATILPLYVALFPINFLLQALKKAMWTMWIGIYRQGIGIALFIWVFTQVFDWGLNGVRIGIAVAVATGLILSLSVAQRIARKEIGGLAISKPLIKGENILYLHII